MSTWNTYAGLLIARSEFIEAAGAYLGGSNYLDGSGALQTLPYSPALPNTPRTAGDTSFTSLQGFWFDKSWNCTAVVLFQDAANSQYYFSYAINGGAISYTADFAMPAGVTVNSLRGWYDENIIHISGSDNGIYAYDFGARALNVTPIFTGVNPSATALTMVTQAGYAWSVGGVFQSVGTVNAAILAVLNLAQNSPSQCGKGNVMAMNAAGSHAYWWDGQNSGDAPFPASENPPFTQFNWAGNGSNGMVVGGYTFSPSLQSFYGFVPGNSTPPPPVVIPPRFEVFTEVTNTTHGVQDNWI